MSFGVPALAPAVWISESLIFTFLPALRRTSPPFCFSVLYTMPSFSMLVLTVSRRVLSRETSPGATIMMSPFSLLTSLVPLITELLILTFEFADFAALTI